MRNRTGKTSATQKQVFQIDEISDRRRNGTRNNAHFIQSLPPRPSASPCKTLLLLCSTTSTTQAAVTKQKPSQAAPGSIGHVASLAVDVIAANSVVEATRVAASAFVKPLVCCDAASLSLKTKLDAAIQIAETKDAVVLLFRSQVFEGHQRKFADELVAWIKENQFSSVILLSSFDAFKRTDAQIQSDSLLRFLSTPAPIVSPFAQQCSSTLNWIQLEQFKRDEEMKDGRQFPIDGGLTDALWSRLVEYSIPTLLVSMFVPEDGFHFQQAMYLAKSVNQLVNFGKSDEWKIPYSWHDAALTTVTATALYT
ncbi:Proteasome assembly chaperone 2 [Rhizoclosmatium sp. JEL0117]|nr:Proteasome assembly chaperone 2 [Rhizoclosmatium sp. JEL0117]